MTLAALLSHHTPIAQYSKQKFTVAFEDSPHLQMNSPSMRSAPGSRIFSPRPEEQPAFQISDVHRGDRSTFGPTACQQN
ncbi:hypothetical protein VTO73DRAFT_182 [Trametes versicolor]